MGCCGYMPLTVFARNCAGRRGSRSTLQNNIVYLWYCVCQDVLTDLKADAELLPVEPINEDWFAHKVCCAH